MARYQQGIGTPDTLQDQLSTILNSLGGRQRGIGTPTSLGGRLGTWQDPQGQVVRGTLPRFTAGVSRNYGSAGNYVNTTPSRWKPEDWSTMHKINRAVGQATGFGAQSAQLHGRRSGATRTMASDADSGIEKAKQLLSSTYSGEPSDFVSAYQRGVEINRAVSSGFDVPTGQGLAVPPAPLQAKNMGLKMPPVPGTEKDIFTEMIRQTPELSESPSGAQFKNNLEDTNPFPANPLAPEDVLNPSVMLQSRSTKSQSRRQTNRRGSI